METEAEDKGISNNTEITTNEKETVESVPEKKEKKEKKEGGEEKETEKENNEVSDKKEQAQIDDSNSKDKDPEPKVQDNNHKEIQGPNKDKDKKKENGVMENDSITAKLKKSSWKDSLILRRDKLKDKRHGSVSNLNALPPSDERQGSLSKRIGKAVMISVNKLRGRPSKDKIDGEDEDAGEEEEGGEVEEGREKVEDNGVKNENDEAVDLDETANVKRIASLPNLSTGIISDTNPNPHVVRRNSDPPPPLPSILRAKDIKKHQSNSTSGLVIVKFNEIVTVRRTWAKKDYDRKGEVTWKLTPDKAIEIRNELNEFKREMEVHLESRGNTHFY